MELVSNDKILHILCMTTIWEWNMVVRKLYISNIEQSQCILFWQLPWWCHLVKNNIEFWFHLELLTWLRCFLSPEPLREESSSLTSSSSELRMSVTSWSETKRTNQKRLNNGLWLVWQWTNQRLKNLWLVWLWIISD